jgi:hypothetical protein
MAKKRRVNNRIKRSVAREDGKTKLVEYSSLLSCYNREVIVDFTESFLMGPYAILEWV